MGMQTRDEITFVTLVGLVMFRRIIKRPIRAFNWFASVISSVVPNAVKRVGQGGIKTELPYILGL